MDYKIFLKIFYYIYMSQFGGKPKKSSSHTKRHFTVVIRNKEHGLYDSSTPSSAARKAVTKLCATNKSKKVNFYIRETTQGSKKKTYGPYIGYIEKLKNPIKYKPVAKLNRKYFMKGGNEKILHEMREFIGEFVLVLGSSRDQAWFIDFERLPENFGKKVISINWHGEADNNFKLDFNDENTWIQLREFEERFRTIIFDYSVDKFINPSNSFDIITKINNLLMVNGKFYKYFSYGSVYIPNDIKKELIDREFCKRDLNVIESQLQININVMEKLKGISTYKIYNTEYGFCYYFTSAQSSFKNLISVHGGLGKNQLLNNSGIFNRQYFESMHKYIFSLYKFYNQLYFVNLLQKKYNFSTEVIESCDSYPLNNPNKPSIKKYRHDYCYIICTKK
jgi:hypothetical protein